MTHGEIDAIVTRFAALLELSFGSRMFTRRGETSGQLYTIRRIHKDGRVQLISYPQTSKIVDVIVEPETLVRA
jgi:hypothetical protein